MIEEFLSKLNNNEYISNYLYEYVLNNNSSVILTSFSIDEYNGKILDKNIGMKGCYIYCIDIGLQDYFKNRKYML